MIFAARDSDVTRSVRFVALVKAELDALMTRLRSHEDCKGMLPHMVMGELDGICDHINECHQFMLDTLDQLKSEPGDEEVTH